MRKEEYYYKFLQVHIIWVALKEITQLTDGTSMPDPGYFY